MKIIRVFRNDGWHTIYAIDWRRVIGLIGFGFAMALAGSGAVLIIARWLK